jgi:hypothetical protein
VVVPDDPADVVPPTDGVDDQPSSQSDSRITRHASRGDASEDTSKAGGSGYRQEVSRVDANNGNRLRETMHHCLLGVRWYRSVLHVDDVGDRNTDDLGPSNRLEVMVHGVFDTAGRVNNICQGVIVQRITAVGSTKRLGIVRYTGQSDHPPVAFSAGEREKEAFTMSLLHAVESATTLRRNQRCIQNDRMDPASERSDNPWDNEASRGVRDERDAPFYSRAFNIGHDRRDLLIDRQRPKFGRMSCPPRQVKSDRGLAEVRDQSIPEARRRAPAMNEHPRHHRTTPDLSFMTAEAIVTVDCRVTEFSAVTFPDPAFLEFIAVQQLGVGGRLGGGALVSRIEAYCIRLSRQLPIAFASCLGWAR